MKHTLKILSFMLMVLVCAPSASAQRRMTPRKAHVSRHQLASIQAEEIARTMNLDEKTTNKFVTAFCQYKQEVENTVSKTNSGPKDRNKMSESEVDAMIRERFNKSRKLVDVREKYYKLYRTFLTPKQIEKVYELEKNQMEIITRKRVRR